MPRPKGMQKSGGRARGTPNRASQRRQAQVAASGLSPLDFLIATLRNESLDLPTRLEAARAAAPFVHPRLAVIDSTVRTESATPQLSEEERRQRARQAILDAFAERPLKLIEGEVVEVDAAEMLATEPESLGESMGGARSARS